MQNTYSIKDVASLTGLPASTLRYYESIGVIGPIGRGETSSHRVYSEDDLNLLTSVACLSATGMSVSDMRTYVANGERGPAAAPEQIQMLADQEQRLAVEAEQIELRQQYVQIKIAYWQAIEAGDTSLAGKLSDRARALADDLKKVKH
jgi:DNA-binding transcriptional MerR regulator